MNNSLEELIQQSDSLALYTVMLDPEDIPGLGEVLKALESIEDRADKIRVPSLSSLIRAMKAYIEKVILREKSDLSPFEEGISQLQGICRELINENEFSKDITSLLKDLEYESMESSASSHPEDEVIREQEKDRAKGGESIRHDGADEATREKGTSGFLGEEDKEIINDFVTESLENLGTIEVKLMDLEQDPSDLDTLNAIFRPFHTIKGVSGFLNFNKINTLSHISENLLDKARNMEISVDGGMIDAILESVDILRKMIEGVQTTLEAGVPSEGDFHIEPIKAKIEELIDQSKTQKPLGEMLVERGEVSRDDVNGALAIQEKEQEKKIGEILLEQKKVGANQIVSTLREQKRAGQPVALQIKVDTGKLDNMVDMVGELAIAQSMLRQNQVIMNSKDRKLEGIIGQLNQITSGLQKTAMSLRMVPIKNTFQKMVRLVRDLSKKSGKEVRLLMSGEDTEIDRNMVEEIYEPMVHMIRNSIDHGLESPNERQASGKFEQGIIHLKAYHRGGNIVIEIEDDGRGLNREQIVDKARANGLINESDKLSDKEIDQLIFHPGFSTADKVTDISGRGVGMDVVKSIIIDRLKGSIEVQSTRGKGTTMIIRMPLTLAIIDGMVVRIEDQRYIIPTLNVHESFRPTKSDCHTVNKREEMVMVRGQLVPLMRITRLFGSNGDHASAGEKAPPWERLAVVVENQDNKRCLLVDELLGKEEIVIKSLSRGLQHVKGIAGGAILGDGRVGLILDVAGICAIASGG
ncbi:MAG: chemotaxis protein CheA [Thermodesulfobacteriota bacterium]